MDETLRGILLTSGISDIGMEAIRRGLGAGVVCLDELTRRGTGFGCFDDWAIPATGVAKVKMVRIKLAKGRA
ncbi:MAG: hypothetical protein ICV60_19480 [Pyrinomonadaceae bacterium]|nr:hypothetical protein [Pyrinomonadaceae bacterium]